LAKRESNPREQAAATAAALVLHIKSAPNSLPGVAPRRRLYAHRTVGGHRDHCHPRRDALARVWGGPKPRPQGVKCMSNMKQASRGFQALHRRPQRLLFFPTPTAGDGWVQGSLDFNSANPSNWDLNTLLDPKVAVLGTVYQKPGHLPMSRGLDNREPSRGGARVSTHPQRGPPARPIGTWSDGKTPHLRLLAGRCLCRAVQPATPAANGKCMPKRRRFGRPSPSMLWVFVDEASCEHQRRAGSVSACPILSRRPPTRGGSIFRLVSTATRGAFSFMDGHAEIHKWIEGASLGPRGLGARVTDWASLDPGRIPNHRDIIWVARRTSALDNGPRPLVSVNLCPRFPASGICADQMPVPPDSFQMKTDSSASFIQRLLVFSGRRWVLWGRRFPPAPVTIVFRSIPLPMRAMRPLTGVLTLTTDVPSRVSVFRGRRNGSP